MEVTRPVNTYHGQGTTKNGLDPSTHAIIHMIDQAAVRLAKETGMTKDPIAIEPASPDQKLDQMSRINFGKVYTVEHNVKVLHVGKIHESSMARFQSYWRNSVHD